MMSHPLQAATLHELWYNIFIRWCRDYGWSDDTDGRVYNEEPYGWVQDALCLIAMSRRGLTEVQSNIFFCLFPLPFLFFSASFPLPFRFLSSSFPLPFIFLSSYVSFLPPDLPPDCR